MVISVVILRGNQGVLSKDFARFVCGAHVDRCVALRGRAAVGPDAEGRRAETRRAQSRVSRSLFGRQLPRRRSVGTEDVGGGTGAFPSADGAHVHRFARRRWQRHQRKLTAGQFAACERGQFTGVGRWRKTVQG